MLGEKELLDAITSIDFGLRAEVLQKR